MRTEKRLRFGSKDELNRLRRRRRIWLGRNVLLLVVFLLLFALGFNRVIDYEHNIIRKTYTIEGAILVPVLEIRPAQGETSLVVIIAHGFFGSKDLMIGFGVELARAGVTAYLFDFPGYGESSIPLVGDSVSQRTEQINITTVGEVVDYARSHNSATEHPRLLLLGYSIGSAAVDGYLLAHANDSDIVSTILISPIGGEETSQTQPKNLLVLVGQYDLPETIANSKRLLRHECGLTDSQLIPVECGNLADGTGRRLTVLPNLNHFTILIASSTFQEILNWLHRAYPQLVDISQMQSDIRNFWLLLGAVGVLLSVFPLSSLLIDIFDIRPPPRVLRWQDVLLFDLCLLLGIVAAVAIQYAWRPFSFVRVLLADYVSGYLFLTAVVAAILFLLVRRMLPVPLIRQPIRQLLLAISLAIFLYFTLGQLITFTWQHFIFTVPRLWRCAVIFALIWPIFLLDEGINRSYQEQRVFLAFLSSLGFKALLVTGLFVAIYMTAGLEFLSVVLPVLGLIFLLLVIFCIRLYSTGRAAIATATLSALVLAWMMTAMFPIT